MKTIETIRTMQSIQNLDLVTAVDLNFKLSEGKPVYHFIYASQLYGTMFAVYAKFSGKEENNTFLIEQISLTLLNYKGNLNIGFTGFQLDESTINEIGFTVRGACSNFEKNSILKAPIAVQKGQRRLITFVRTVIPLPDYEGYLEERVGEESKLLSTEPPVSPWFDTEFNDRDGVDLYNTHQRPGMVDYQAQIVGFRCNTSRVNFYY